MSKIYDTVISHGRKHVICEAKDRSGYLAPNYLGTKRALCGVLLRGQTLENWLEQRRSRRVRKPAQRGRRPLTTETIPA